ncbi:hypothetical protein Csa_007258 [Cucumis sativus]|uniref:Transmembrane protein n=1 Tax=Cucumis sativus TaxID=3659 RepID=A0A0A0M192_CUCSA|nr:hypothetical protein Csa_007258 [Cucumis sativus]
MGFTCNGKKVKRREPHKTCLKEKQRKRWGQWRLGEGIKGDEMKEWIQVARELCKKKESTDCGKGVEPKCGRGMRAISIFLSSSFILLFAFFHN